ASFSQLQFFGATVNPWTAAAADFNGDGKLDVITTDVKGDYALALMNTTTAGASSASFTADLDVFATEPGAWSVTTGDVNGDGKPDVIATSYNSGQVSVLVTTTPAGAAMPTFAPVQAFEAGDTPWALTVGDFNGDQLTDLAVTNANPDTVSVLPNAFLPVAISTATATGTIQD